MKKFLKSIYSHKYHVLLFILSFVLFFIILIPEKRIIQAGLKTIEKETGIKVELIKPNLKFIPNFGIDAEKVILKLNGQDIELGETDLYISWISLILMSPDIELNTKSFKGNVNVKIFGFPINEKLQFLDMDFTTKNVDLSSFKNLMPKTLNLSGFIDVYLTGILNLDNFIYSDVSVQLKTKDLFLKETKIMGINVPNIDVGTSDVFTSISKANLTITKLILGSADRDINLDLKGNYSFQRNGEYSLFVDLKLKDKFEKEYESFLSFIKNARKQDGSYKFKATGNSRAPIPMITPIN